MKKKNNASTTGNNVNTTTSFYIRRANRTAAQQNNIGKYFGNNGSGTQAEGNIYGESEEDYYSRA